MAKKEKPIQNFFEKGKKTERTEEFLAKTDGIVKNEKKKFAKIILIAAVFTLVAGSLGTAGYFYFKYKKAMSGNAAKDENNSYIAEIKKFMDLPEGEEPTLATVSDREKLQGQPFFAKAENGDKVLIYSQAKKAILYRPSSNKIIEVTSLTGGLQGENNNSAVAENPGEKSANNSNQQSGEEQPVETPVAEVQKTPVRVAVYNGANIKGLAAALAEKISAIAGTEIIQKTNAVGNYDKTIIIDLTGKNEVMAKKISETLGGEIGELPESETKPDADILIIGGNDQK